MQKLAEAAEAEMGSQMKLHNFVYGCNIVPRCGRMPCRVCRPLLQPLPCPACAFVMHRASCTVFRSRLLHRRCGVIMRPQWCICRLLGRSLGHKGEAWCSTSCRWQGSCRCAPHMAIAAQPPAPVKFGGGGGALALPDTDLDAIDVALVVREREAAASSQCCTHRN